MITEMYHSVAQVSLHCREIDRPANSMINSISLQPFGQFWRNLCGDAHSSFQSDGRPKIWKAKSEDGGHIKNLKKKRDISYVRFWQNVAWWCRFGLQTLGLT